MIPPEMRVEDLGEFHLIKLLADALGTQCSPMGQGQLMLSIGDDAAAWRGSGDTTVLTTDTMVEEIHFSLDWTGWEALGWKAIATNQSDIAAMGCTPMYAVVNLGLQGDLPVERLVEMYRGMATACTANGGTVVGGDLVRSPTFFITVTMTGRMEGDGSLLTRDSARPGDVIAVTGNLGMSAGGLQTLRDNIALDCEAKTCLQDAYNQPTPRVREGRALRDLAVVTAIDISDGLIADLGKLCADLRANRIPVTNSLKSVFPDDWLTLALSGGEDYELAFTAPVEVVQLVAKTLNVRVTPIGQIRQGKGVRVLDTNDTEITVGHGGWDHFG